MGRTISIHLRMKGMHVSTERREKKARPAGAQNVRKSRRSKQVERLSIGRFSRCETAAPGPGYHDGVRSVAIGHLHVAAVRLVLIAVPDSRRPSYRPLYFFETDSRDSSAKLESGIRRR